MALTAVVATNCSCSVDNSMVALSLQDSHCSLVEHLADQVNRLGLRAMTETQIHGQTFGFIDDLPCAECARCARPPVAVAQSCQKPGSPESSLPSRVRG